MKIKLRLKIRVLNRKWRLVAQSYDEYLNTCGFYISIELYNMRRVAQRFKALQQNWKVSHQGKLKSSTLLRGNPKPHSDKD